ncbi:MAG: hypothetical protein K5872_19635 [Rhizobiaceae bacterium]|nr:hypothetical protein [Rhizobiaceae bacterium]MCV0408433.1 hypothetical protein [Rhizobiaceae bacterium]
MRRLARVALVVAAVLLASPAQAADRSDLLIHHLLDLDQQALFGDDYTPLAEMEAWGELYAAAREEAVADDSADRRGIKTFMLIGWIARQRADFGTIEGFNTDFKALFDARPNDVLAALADTEFMLPEMCRYLAGFFFFEDADPDKRQGFVDANTHRMERHLGEAGQAACLDAFWAVKS